MTRDERVYVFTKGTRDEPQWGYECADIAEIDLDGKVKGKPFSQDYTRTGDSKKRGLDGTFTSSGRYCILNSVYQNTDPWKGRQMLFDMVKQQLIEVALPRGYAKHRLVDHAGDWFWAERNIQGESRRIARLRVE